VRIRLGLLLLLAASWGCSTLEVGKPADWPDPGSGGSYCLQSPYVQAVLEAVKDRMLHQWRLPDGIRADESVVLGFILDADGRVVRSAVFESSNTHLAYSALRALRESEPLEIPADAACLVGIPIVGTFTNPSRR
jgi:hypothetical protein